MNLHRVGCTCLAGTREAGIPAVAPSEDARAEGTGAYSITHPSHSRALFRTAKMP